MESTPSLELVAAEVAAELGVQERRGDALDAKAGLVLGFAGVLAGLGLERLSGIFAITCAMTSVVAALAAVAALIPRSTPTLDVMKLREAYLTLQPDQTRLRLLDTRVAMFGSTQTRLSRKAALVTLAALALATSGATVVLGATLD